MAGVEEVAVGLYAKIFYEDDKKRFITVPLNYVKNYDSILEKPENTWKFFKKLIWFEPEEGDTASKAEYKNGFIVQISDDLQQLLNSSDRVSLAPKHLVLSSEGENMDKLEAKKRKNEKMQGKQLAKKARILREQELLDGMPSTSKQRSKDDEKDEFARKQDLLNKFLNKYKKPPRKNNKNNEGKNKEKKSRRNSKNGIKPAKNKKIDDESTLKAQTEFQNLDEEREDVLSMTFKNNIDDFIAPMQSKRTVLQAAMLKAKNIFPELLSNSKEVPSEKSKTNQDEDSGEPPLFQDISPQCPEIVNLNSRRQSKEQPGENEQIEHTFSEKSSSSEQNSSAVLEILHSDSKDDKINMLEISLKKKEEEVELLKKNHKIEIDALENMYRRLLTAAGNSQILGASETSNGKKTEKLGEGVELEKVWLSNNRTIQRSASVYTGVLLVEILGEEVLRKSSYSGHSRDGTSKNAIPANVIAAVKNEVHGWLVTHKSYETSAKAMEHLDKYFTVWVNRKIQSIQPSDPKKKKLKTRKPKDKGLPARGEKVPSSSFKTNGVINDSSTDEESVSEGDEKSACEADEQFVSETDE